MEGTSSDPNSGQLLANRYELSKLIGKGSMGRVYLAEDTLLGKVPVAVKFLAQALLDEGMRIRFAHEARTGAQLGQKSIHIVRVLDYGVNPAEVPFYVMEYLAGESLSDAISAQPLSLPRFLVLTRHICLALQCAHQGINLEGKLCPIIHRDIKPSNVLIIQDPSLGELAKILDFGIAKFLSDQVESNRTQAFMGTPAYCSPEQMEGGELDSRSDIYSLGVMMFEMLTGQMPIQPETHTISSWYKAHRYQPPNSLEVMNPSLRLPQQLQDLVMSCLAKLPSDRPQSLLEILDILELFEQRLGVIKDAQPQQRASSSSQPTAPQSHSASLSIEQLCWQATWPADKPIAEIVFSQPIHAPQKPMAALWAMMPQADITQRLLSTRYNQFLCSIAPHPMVLWITAVYDTAAGARWLPCYLDLQSRGYKIASLLGEAGHYPLLFFALETPQRCSNVMTVSIAPYQCQLLREWLQMSRSYTSTAAPATTKSLLKVEFERLKPQILQKLAGAKQTLRK